MNVKAAGLHGIEVSICGIAELADYSVHGVTHVISIWEGVYAGKPEPRLRIKSAFPEARSHFVFFDDIETPFRGEHAPDRASIDNVIGFTGGMKQGDYLLVHCAAGVSRSTAMAYAALCHHAGQGFEKECYDAIKEIRPCASPNSLVVRIADDLLGRKGAMMKAIWPEL